MEYTEKLTQLDSRLTAAGITFYREEPMSRHTTLRIGGPAERLVCPDSERQLLTAAKLCRELELPVLLIGRGSNLLVSDQGLRGVVLCPRAETGEITCTGEGRFRLPAGLTLARAANFAAEQGYAGLEFAHGIPGTVGGAVYMNAGAYGGEMKDIITRVEVLDSDGTVRWLPADECGFSYRHSRFSHSGEWVLSAEVQLTPGCSREIYAVMDRLGTARREKQPLEYPSAGSAFKRPPEGTPPAAALIDRCGLKGLQVGGAQVSEKHAGFIINRGGATASEVAELMRQVQKTVQEREGVLLEPEIRLLGSFEEGM